MSYNRILVTGGAGFIGSHLCKRLLSEGNEVICLDSFFTGRKSNLTSILDHPRFEIVRHDIRLPIDVEVDQIFNLACPASPVYYQLDPIKTMETSVLGAMNVLNLALKKNASVLQASTSEVYGDPLEHPQTESYWGNVNPIGIRSCYDEGKRCAETLFFDYNRKYSLETKIIRIFNTYGPNMQKNDGRVVSNFIIQALQGKNITIYGTGQQTRSFCYVSNLVDGMIKMMATDKEFTGPVNLGNPEEYTMIALAEMIINLTGSKSKIEFKTLPADDPKQRKPNIEIATNKLGWVPDISLNEGLLSTIKYFEEEIQKDGF